MIDLAREVARVRHPIFAISACAWGALAVAPATHLNSLAVCGGAASAVGSLSISLTMNSLSAFAAGWALMLLAMMSPLVVPEIDHVRFTNFGTPPGAIDCALRGRLRRSSDGVRSRSDGRRIGGAGAGAGCYIPATVAGLLACVWQVSPYKQWCLNKCHDNRPLRVFGVEADLDAFRFGWTRGVWCAASCSAAMLISMLLPEGHLAAMAAVAILAYCERLEDPDPPRWKLRGLGKAWRMMAARLRIRWRMLRRANEVNPVFGISR